MSEKAPADDSSMRILRVLLSSHGGASGLGAELSAARHSGVGQRPIAQAAWHSAENGAKYFATADVLETAKDRAWLVKMTNTISQHWQHQNTRKDRVAPKNHVSEFQLPEKAGR